MRTARDRLRHAVLFELIALIIIAPLGGLLFDVPWGHFGVVAVVSTTVAMSWNYVYNLGFDHAMVRFDMGFQKTLLTRIIHAVCFELGLLCLLVPFIALYLRVSLWEAFVMDVVLAGFYVLYAFTFNWGYDTVYPIRSRSG